MPRNYNKKKVIFNVLLEKFFFVVFYPFILIQKPNREKVRSILIVEPFQIGDILSLTPLVEPLLRKYPESIISFLTKPGSGVILTYDSRIHQVYTTDFPWSDHGEKKFSFGRLLLSFKYAFDLRRQGFDLGIDTRGDIRSQVLLVLAGCKSRVGYLNYLQSNINLSGHLLNHYIGKSRYSHRYEWNISLLTALGFQENELFPIQFPSFYPDKIKSVINQQLKTIVIHVGGGWVYRRWSEAKWIELIDILQSRPYDSIMVIGGVGERDILNRIESGVIKKSKIQFKVTTLKEMINEIDQCTLFIGLDSGPMNLAVCLNRKIIALFGPGDSSMWKPLNAEGRFIQKVNNFPCSPCLQLECIFPKKNCMSEIDVDDVIGLLAESPDS
jgi:ADP-heptose:LPS heptosyltransferase